MHYVCLLFMRGEATELIALQWMPDICSKGGRKRYDTTTDTGYSSWHDKTGQGRAGQGRTGQYKTVQYKTVQDRAGQDRTGRAGGRAGEDVECG